MGSGLITVGRVHSVRALGIGDDAFAGWLLHFERVRSNKAGHCPRGSHVSRSSPSSRNGDVLTRRWRTGTCRSRHRDNWPRWCLLGGQRQPLEACRLAAGSIQGHRSCHETQARGSQGPVGRSGNPGAVHSRIHHADRDHRQSRSEPSSPGSCRRRRNTSTGPNRKRRRGGRFHSFRHQIASSA